MDRAGYTHLVVYADREHFANLAWLTGFDPRFEEALLIVRPEGRPLLLVGTECESYLPISPLFVAGKLRTERFEPFALLDISRDQSRQLDAIFKEEGIEGGARVGSAGWKYFSAREHPLGERALEIPAYIADTLRALTLSVVNATGLFQDAAVGLRAELSPYEIALFEYTNQLASNGMSRMIHAIREGISDFELAAQMGFNGLPLSCHWTLKTGPNRISLASPNGTIVRPGQPLSANIAFHGANCCRAGWVANGETQAPEGYVEKFAGPYFDAMGEWFRLLRIGTPGGEVDRRMRELLPDDVFHCKLNPGHLISLDEWMSSPFKPGSEIPLRSGMAIQADVIPSHPVMFSTRMEDTFVLADSQLRSQLWKEYPATLARAEARRGFMESVLGFELSNEVLPLSNLAGIVPPYLLSPRTVLAL